MKPILRPLVIAAVLISAHGIADEAGGIAEGAGGGDSGVGVLGGFGSGEPVERREVPERGQIVVAGGAKMEAMEHWDQYGWKVSTPRWGRYEVYLTYGLKMNSLGVQLKLGEERLKARLTAAPFDAPKEVSLGRLYFATAGEHLVNLYTPPVQKLEGIEFKQLRLVPAPEGDEMVEQGEEGEVVLEAKGAVTWSTTMRYEPKPEKNCLGYWTQVEDWAEWEFSVGKAGKFDVVVFQGCGGKEGGSEVEVILGEQVLPFKVVGTGGFQNFEPVAVGQVEIGEAGSVRLAIKPKTKVGGAIMDVQKVVLTPVK